MSPTFTIANWTYRKAETYTSGRFEVEDDGTIKESEYASTIETIETVEACFTLTGLDAAPRACGKSEGPKLQALSVLVPFRSKNREAWSVHWGWTVRAVHIKKDGSEGAQITIKPYDAPQALRSLLVQAQDGDESSGLLAWINAQYPERGARHGRL